MQQRVNGIENSCCAIAVMAKASVPGKAKTRLVPPLAAHEAADLNTAFLRDIGENLMAASKLANISGWIAYAPADSASFFRSILPNEIGLIEAAAPDLGACLLRAITTLLDGGSASTCVLNSDSPTLPTAYLVAAATVLSVPGDRVVIGPSIDGGYYLLGVKQAHRRLFEDIAWSTEHVFRQTLERAAEIGLDTVVLPTWYDVDDADSLRLLTAELSDGRHFRVEGSEPPRARWTQSQLARLLDGLSLDARLDRRAIGT